MHIEDNVRAGMAPEEARRQALIKLGGMEQTKERYRERRGLPWLESLVQDVRFGLRMLRKNPGFTAVAVLTLALGIGATTSVFSVVDAVLLRPLPYPNPQQIVRIWQESRNGHRTNLAGPNFEDFLAQNDTFASLAEYEYGPAPLSGGSEPVRVNVAAVSSGFFRCLGVYPFRGRAFAPEEQRLDGSPAAIVSYSYWKRYLGGATDLSGFRLAMEGRVYAVVGVMPAGFDFPPGVAAWVPRELFPKLPSRTAHNFRGIGRVRDGVTVTQARTNLSAIAQRIKEQYGNNVDLRDAVVVPLAEAMVGDVRTALLVSLGAVSLLLLVACANIAGLLLARNSVRRRELALRAALGASRGRLIQQSLTESFILSLAGGAVAILTAIWTVKALPAMLPLNLPRQQGIEINTSVLVFALVVVVAVAVSLGVFAARRSGAGDLKEALGASSSRSSGVDAGNTRLRGLLVIGEIASTFVVLVGAGLLGHSFLRLISTSSGFREENLITMEFSPPVPQEQAIIAPSDMAPPATARQIHLMEDIVGHLGALPGTETVGLASALPVAAGDNLPEGDFLILDGQKPPTNSEEFERMAQNRSEVGHAEYCVVGEEYFRTLGIPLVRGRMFTGQDDLNSPNVALISQSLARERWPNGDPVGQILEFGNMDGNLKPLTVVGVVGDVRAAGLDRPPSPIIYADYRQRGMSINSLPTIVLRGAAPVGETVAAARGIFRDIAPDVPVKYSTFAEEMGGWLADRRSLFLLISFFAAVAVVLAAVGVYGVVAFSIERRTQEIGIRMALGAQRGDIFRLVVGEVARMAAIGVVIGIAISLAITRLMSTLLFGISATDPLTFVGVAVLLSVVALVASYIPARRATRVDPMVALRYE